MCSKFCCERSEPDLDAGISEPAVVGVAGRWVKVLLPYRMKGTPLQTEYF